MTPAEIQMQWRMMCACMPAAIDVTISPDEILEENPELNGDQVMLIHQQACADMAWDYAYAAMQVIRRKGVRS